MIQGEDPERPWDQPGIRQVEEGVFRVPLPMPEDGLRAVNAYLLVGRNALTVVDPGVDVEPARVALDVALAQLGAGLADIDVVLVTHFHYDHYSRAAAIHDSIGTTVGLGALEDESLRALQTANRPLSRQAQQLRAHGAGALAAQVEQLPSDQRINELVSQIPSMWLTDGDTVATGPSQVSAIHTPGHTRGHVVFRDEDRGLLFAGDHVLPSITPSIGFEPSEQELPLRNYLNSLQRVRSLPDTLLLPAHGPVAGSVHTRIDELLTHHDNRLQHVSRAIGDGATTALEAAALLRWTSRNRRLIDLDVFNRMLAVLETSFHLDLLHVRGDLERTCVDDTWRYSPPVRTSGSTPELQQGPRATP